MKCPLPKIEVQTEINFIGGCHMDIVVEGNVIRSCLEYSEAMALLFACYYIFNLQFPKELKKYIAILHEVHI